MDICNLHNFTAMMTRSSIIITVTSTPHIVLTIIDDEISVFDI